MEKRADLPDHRPSVSHAASRRVEIERVRQLTVEERIKAALSMASRFAGLQPTRIRE